jgi:hypothetical protein
MSSNKSKRARRKSGADTIWRAQAASLSLEDLLEFARLKFPKKKPEKPANLIFSKEKVKRDILTLPKEKFICSNCNLIFNSRFRLNQHLKNSHDLPKK